MKSKKNLAATLALLMTMQATGQPWAVLANEVDEGTAEPVISENDEAGAAQETSEAPVIDEQPETQEDVEQPEPVIQEESPVAETPEPAQPEEEKLPAFEAMSEDGSYTAKVETLNGTYDIADVQVDLGNVAEKAPNMEAGQYYYRKATVNGQEINAVRTWKMEKDPAAKTYYQLKNGDGGPVELQAGEQVVLTYEFVEPKKEEAPKQEAASDEGLKADTVKKDAAAFDATAATPETEYFEVKFFDQSIVEGELQKNADPITTQWIKNGEQAVTPAVQTPDGYVFTGWSQSASVPITANTEYVAQYEKLANPIKLTINYEYEDSTVIAQQPWVANV